MFERFAVNFGGIFEPEPDETLDLVFHFKTLSLRLRIFV
jgi:hypothetical protein